MAFVGKLIKDFDDHKHENDDDDAVIVIVVGYLQDISYNCEITWNQSTFA